jgi:hypothetical protein
MGILGRETKFGKVRGFIDPAIEFSMDWGLGFIPDAMLSGFNKVRKMVGADEKNPSLGVGQFQKKVWDAHGLDKKIGPFEESFTNIKQGLGVLYRINDDYNLAIETGNGTGPSVNPIAIKQGKITSINGTGNNAMDLAIVNHNMSGMINKWCETSDPKYAGPCNETVYQPFKTTKPEIKVTVKTNKPISNYFPNKGSGELTSIGYLEQVTDYMNSFNCYSI